MKRLVYILLFPLIFTCTRTDTLQSTDNVRREEQVMELFSEYTKSFPEIPSISVQKLLDLKQTANSIIVDVREKEEREVSVIPGSISIEEFEQNIDTYAGHTVAVYCTIGYRSGLYAQKLTRMGFKVFNVEGGILAWLHAGQPVLGKDVKPTARVHVYGSRWDLGPQELEGVW